ncbi:MAG TPA: amidohydrolase family protein [Pyrinomonadaceae bacterium]|nr:amidohydrolase family protein [Pyrinomonadaceae bacterium]
MRVTNIRSIVLVTALLTLAQVSAYAQVTAIKAGRLIDPETGSTALNQVILVEKGKITSVGANTAIPAGATVIDLSRSTVLPGLFDMHTHLCMTVQARRDNGNYFYTSLNDPDSFRSIEGVVNARAMLESGFTTVRDVGNEGNYACTSVRRAIDRGMVPGPTMYNAGRIIAPYGGQFQLQPDKQNLAEPEYFFADTRDEMLKAVRQNAHYGARLIKIVVDDQRYIYSPEDIRFIVQEAEKMGLKVAAHCWTHKGAHNAAEAGVASIEHGFGMTDDDLELARRNGVALVGTEYVGLKSKEELPQWIDRLKRAYRVGVTMAYGTDAATEDAGQTRGTEAISGIDVWVMAGIPPRVTLQAMTVNAARLLGVDKQRGAIRQGMAADIIATPENPLENINALKQVSFVMKDGRVFKHVR